MTLLIGRIGQDLGESSFLGQLTTTAPGGGISVDMPVEAFVPVTKQVISKQPMLSPAQDLERISPSEWAPKTHSR